MPPIASSAFAGTPTQHHASSRSQFIRPSGSIECAHRHHIPTNQLLLVDRSPSCAPNDRRPTMATFLAHITVKPGREADFEAIVVALAGTTHASEPGVRRYEYWRAAA